MIHKKHNYIVDITELEDSSIFVTFPKNIFLKLDRMSVIFATEADKVIIIYNKDGEELEDFIEEERFMPPHCMRYYIIKEIISIASNRGISLDLIDVNKIYKSLNAPENLLSEIKIFENYPSYLLGEDVEESVLEDIKLIEKETVFEDIIS